MVFMKPKQQKIIKTKLPKKIEKTKEVRTKKPRVKEIYETNELTEPTKKKVKYLMPSKNVTEELVKAVELTEPTKKKMRYVMPSKSVTEELVKAVELTEPIRKKVKYVMPSKSVTEELVKAVELTEPIRKKVKYVMPSKSVTEELVKASLKALQQMTAHYKKKNTIFDDESPIFAEINSIKIQNSRGNIKFVLPHSTVASTGEVCLITPDLKKGKKSDHEPTIDHWEEILRNAGVTSVKTILPMRQLRVEYDQFELKRRLLTQHDFIMVDTRVLNHVSHVLGKMFFKKHNMLIPVRLNDTDNIKKAIDVGFCTAMLRLSEGATSTITVGHTAMSQKDLKENVMSLIQQLREKYPGGEANIRSIGLKLPLSLSLPLYITLRPSSTVTAPKLKQRKPKNFAVLEDELTTIPGSTVRVAPDGTVHLKKSKTNESDNSDVESEEQKEENAGATSSAPDNSD